MIGASLFGAARSILLLGAHCDDIEIGCGGTLLRLAALAPDATIDCVIFSSNSVRAEETRAALEVLAGGRARVHIHEFRNGYFPYVGAEIKDCFETLKNLRPDVVFTHYGDDLHQDHREVSRLTWNTFRDHLILEYEVPKYDGGLGSPSLFVPLNGDEVTRKVDTLMRAFPSESGKGWFSPETFRALMRLRGIECNAPDGYAEAFYLRKLSVTG